MMTGEVCQTHNWIKNHVHSIENACPNRIRSGALVNATGVFDLFHSDDSGRTCPSCSSSSVVIFIRGKATTPGCWKEYPLSNEQKQPVSWTQCFKESFFHFGLCSFSTSVSPSSSPFLLSFPYPVTLSVTLLHCNVRGFARRRTCWTFKSRLGDQKLDVTSHLNRKKEV